MERIEDRLIQNLEKIMINYSFDTVWNINITNRANEPIGIFGRLFTDNTTARVLDYFISHRFHSYSADQVAKDLELSNETVSVAINQLEKRNIVRPDKRTKNSSDSPNDIAYTLYVESMTANVIIRAAFEIANAERISSENETENETNRKI
jgi:hypothetical protein